MSSPNRFLLMLAVALTPLLLAGCGFEPLYGERARTESDSKLLAGVRIDSIGGRPGQLFKSDLEDRLNPSGSMPANPAYRLSVTLRSTITPIGVARDGTVSRYNVYLTSTYILYRNADNKPVTSGDLSYVVSYNNLTNTYFSTYISEEDAIKRGITELSELYRQRLAVYLDSGAPEHAVDLQKMKDFQKEPTANGFSNNGYPR